LGWLNPYDKIKVDLLALTHMQKNLKELLELWITLLVLTIN